MANLGEMFRQIRQSRNWSIRDAAKRMGISYSYLSILERGIDRRNGKVLQPKPETLKAISQVYEYPYNELMKAAGYLHEDNSPKRKFDLTIFISNLSLIMGNMSIEELSDDIFNKTGCQVSPEQIRSYLNGDIEPLSNTIGILSKYAKVNTDFWYEFNTKESLKHERRKYKHSFNKTGVDEVSNDFYYFMSLREDIKEWVTCENSIPYIKMAIEAQRKDVHPNSLKLIIDTVISDRKRK